MRKREGFTLVEMAVVTAIILTLVTVLWLVLGPSSKRKALEVRVRSDLHQLNVAIGLYRADYDDVLPLSLRALKKHIPEAPTKPTGVREPLPGCGNGNVIYIYTRSYDILEGEKHYQAEYPFDIGANPVLKAPFFCRLPGTKKTMVYLDRDGNPQPRLRDATQVLGIRLDGYTGWFDAWEMWEEEFANRAHRN